MIANTATGILKWSWPLSKIRFPEVRTTCDRSYFFAKRLQNSDRQCWTAARDVYILDFVQIGDFMWKDTLFMYNKHNNLTCLSYYMDNVAKNLYKYQIDTPKHQIDKTPWKSFKIVVSYKCSEWLLTLPIRIRLAVNDC